MTTVTPIPYRVRYRPGFAKPGKLAWRDDGHALPPTYSGPHWHQSPAIVMRGWRPRAIEPAKPARSLWTRLSAIAAGVFGRIAEWRERASSRQALLHIDDRSLRDIGMTRFDVRRLVNKPFWRD